MMRAITKGKIRMGTNHIMNGKAKQHHPMNTHKSGVVTANQFEALEDKQEQSTGDNKVEDSKQHQQINTRDWVKATFTDRVEGVGTLGDSNGQREEVQSVAQQGGNDCILIEGNFNEQKKNVNEVNQDKVPGLGSSNKEKRGPEGEGSQKSIQARGHTQSGRDKGDGDKDAGHVLVVEGGEEDNSGKEEPPDYHEELIDNLIDEQQEEEDINNNIRDITIEGDLSPRQLESLRNKSRKGQTTIPLQVKTKSRDKVADSDS